MFSLCLLPTPPNLTLAGISILLKLIAWTAGTEVATNVVVTKVLALGLEILLNRVSLGSTFIKVWKRFREEGLNSCQGTSAVALVSEWSLTRGHKIRSAPDRLDLQAFLMLSGNYHWGQNPGWHASSGKSSLEGKK